MQFGAGATKCTAAASLSSKLAEAVIWPREGTNDIFTAKAGANEDSRDTALPPAITFQAEPESDMAEGTCDTQPAGMGGDAILQPADLKHRRCSTPQGTEVRSSFACTLSDKAEREHKQVEARPLRIEATQASNATHAEPLEAFKAKLPTRVRWLELPESPREETPRHFSIADENCDEQLAIGPIFSPIQGVGRVDRDTPAQATGQKVDFKESDFWSEDSRSADARVYDDRLTNPSAVLLTAGSCDNSISSKAKRPRPNCLGHGAAKLLCEAEIIAKRKFINTFQVKNSKANISSVPLVDTYADIGPTHARPPDDYIKAKQNDDISQEMGDTSVAMGYGNCQVGNTICLSPPVPMCGGQPKTSDFKPETTKDFSVPAAIEVNSPADNEKHARPPDTRFVADILNKLVTAIRKIINQKGKDKHKPSQSVIIQPKHALLKGVIKHADLRRLIQDLCDTAINSKQKAQIKTLVDINGPVEEPGGQSLGQELIIYAQLHPEAYQSNGDFADLLKTMYTILPLMV
jgi:hypothetical protein